MIAFLISGRPTRSMRIGNLPATTVSPTTANSGPRPLLSHGRQSASTTILMTLRPQPEAVDDRVREMRVRCGLWQHIQNEHKVVRALRAGKRIKITDVAGRTCDRPGSGEMV